MQKRNLSAFSLVELSVVIIIIGILIAGVTNGTSLIADFRIKTAQSLTRSSPVAAMEDIVLWLETTSKESFSTKEAVDQSIITNWYDVNPSAALKNNANNPSDTPSDNPTYKESCLNYLPCVYFNGTNNWIDTTRTLGTANEITIFTVTTLPAAGSVDATASSIISAGQSWGTGSFILKRLNGAFYQLSYGGPDLLSGNSAGAGSYIFLSLIIMMYRKNFI
jgi:prepilin-type N-terminal cleavage/methylation domain-containing protein